MITAPALAAGIAAALLFWGTMGIGDGIKKLNCKVTHHTCPVKPVTAAKQ